jgi:polyferredoxin
MPAAIRLGVTLHTSVPSASSNLRIVVSFMADYRPYRFSRRILQSLVMLVFALVPATGLLRIDLFRASFIVAGHEAPWSRFSLMMGLAIIVVTGIILTYFVVGGAWCGWACPQNTLSELADGLTARLLGRKASVDIHDDFIVAPTKNKVVNWILLGGTVLAVSLVVAAIPFMFFYSPGEVLTFTNFQASQVWGSPLRTLYILVAGLVFLDLALVRHFWCKYVCAFRFGQKLFANPEALHIRYDASRREECDGCGYCDRWCITHINPTHVEASDPCIGCGECIDACRRMHPKNSEGALLSYEIANTGNARRWSIPVLSLFKGYRLAVTVLFCSGIALTAYSIATLPRPLPPEDPVVTTRRQHVRAVCENRCGAPMARCVKENVANPAACVEAAACKCSCYIDEDPTSPSRSSWEVCAKRDGGALGRSAPPR